MGLPVDPVTVASFALKPRMNGYPPRSAGRLDALLAGEYGPDRFTSVCAQLDGDRVECGVVLLSKLAKRASPVCSRMEAPAGLSQSIS